MPQSRRIEEWAALLDGALPPHLRDQKVSPPLLTLSAVDLAEVLLAAQRPVENIPRGFDLLYHLGFNQGRWSAVVWLIKKLVDRFPIQQQPDAIVSDYLKLWDQVPSLRPPRILGSAVMQEDDQARPTVLRSRDTGPEFPLHLELDITRSDSTPIAAQTLDELTGSSMGDVGSHQTLAHEALGQIWRTLGAMTLACAGGSIRQEVLEIIAYLHHREVMPMSIYQYQPRMDKSAIQQPPLIPLLSTRIFTSLSDAAWKAHEKLLVEEARARQGDDAAKRPPVLAAPYRARIDGLFLEVWFELILWSCLHGGWVEEGADILGAVARHEDWKPLSWREYEKGLPMDGQLSSDDWDAWEYLFKTRASKSMDPSDNPVPEVQKTVSAEVVNAYIDAIAGLPTESGADLKRSLGKLFKLKAFLNNHNLGLTTGSWDALVVRLLEGCVVEPEAQYMPIAGTVQLSPGLGQGLTSRNTQDLPAYVLDGGSAMQGILNRLLHARILAGNLESALRIFKEMLSRTDRDKQTSLASFMEGPKPLLRALDDNDIFTSNLTGIDYPAFDLQIPPLTLGLLLDLLLEYKSYDFARWLIYSKDADGPVIKKEMYDNQSLTPALVRFATITQDASLFKTLRALPSFDFHLVLDAQIDALRWDAAMGIVNYIGEDQHKSTHRVWSMTNLANLARVMVSQTLNPAENQKNLRNAQKLFSTMIRQVRPKSETAVRAQTLLNVLSSVDAYWAKFCNRLQRVEGYHNFLLTSGQFNSLLEGVVIAYGSDAGRKMLDLFWPQSARRTYTGKFEDHKAPRIVVPLPGMQDCDRAVVYGAVSPNLKTITTILEKALKELREQPRPRHPSQSEQYPQPEQQPQSQSQPQFDQPPRSEEQPLESKNRFRLEEQQSQPQEKPSNVTTNSYKRSPPAPAPTQLTNISSQQEILLWAAARFPELPDPITNSNEIFDNLDRALMNLDMEDVREALPRILAMRDVAPLARSSS